MTPMSYRPFIKKIFWAALFFLIILILILARVFLYDPNLENLIKFAFSSIFPLSILIKLVFWVSPSLFSHYAIYNNLVSCNFLGSKKDYHFSEIDLNYNSFLPSRFFGGFIIVFKNRTILKIPSLLLNSDLLLDKIYKFNNDIISYDDMKLFQKRYKSIDTSWLKLKSKFKQKWRVLSHIILIPSLFSFIWLQVFPQYIKYFQSNITYFIVVLFLPWTLLALINGFEEFLHTKLTYKVENDLLVVNETVYTTVDWLTNIIYYLALASIFTLTI